MTQHPYTPPIQHAPPGAQVMRVSLADICLMYQTLIKTPEPIPPRVKNAIAHLSDVLCTHVESLAIIDERQRQGHAGYGVFQE